MKKISDSVRAVASSSPIATEALRQGWLNLSAYAQHVMPEIERQTLKPVTKGSVVVALSRLASELERDSSLMAQVRIDDLSIKMGLVDIAYEHTAATLKQSRQLGDSIGIQPGDFLTLTQGVREISLICGDSIASRVTDHFTAQPLRVRRGLVGVTVKFGRQQLEHPNVIYTLLSSLAIKRINIEEVVSTLTELTVVVNAGDSRAVSESFQQFFASS